MPKLFLEHGSHAAGNILPREDFRLYADIQYDLDAILARDGARFIADAEAQLEKPYPLLDASLYMQFARNGNRANFEGPYFDRRAMTLRFALAELAERKGRFTDRLVDGIWHILEESTWILPAHNSTNKYNRGVPLPDAFFTAEENDDVKHIDLFSAATAGTMAMIAYFCREILDGVTPVICERIVSQLRQRILHPYYTYTHDGWMGEKGQALNNWTPWILSNVLLIVGLIEKDTARRETAAEKAMVILDRFTRDYPSDGGCDEGPGYWNAAGASFFDCVELLYDLSGGKIDLMEDPFVLRMCEFIMNFSITPSTYINFADAASHIRPDARLIARMGRRLGSADLSAFASSLYRPEICGLNTNQAYRFWRNLAETDAPSKGFTPRAKIWYEGLQVAITREGQGMFLALKGGCNGESHNHNDVGQFILFDAGEPVILDAGVEQYTRTTFSAQRYTLWAMRGAYHNIPEISGIEQQPGRMYHADTVAYDEASGALTLELKNAYPPEAHIDSYRRTAWLADGVATVKDDIRLSEAGEVALHYLTIDCPTVEGNTVCFASGHKAVFDASLTASVETIDLGGGKIAREWRREKLYRITLTAPSVTEASFVLTVTK